MIHKTVDRRKKAKTAARRLEDTLERAEWLTCVSITHKMLFALQLAILHFRFSGWAAKYKKFLRKTELRTFYRSNRVFLMHIAVYAMGFVEKRIYRRLGKICDILFVPSVFFSRLSSTAYGFFNKTLHCFGWATLWTNRKLTVVSNAFGIFTYRYTFSF